jgi:serine/threonine protein kinase
MYGEYDLGWGHFSTVWMCRDTQSPPNQPIYVAMKIQKSADHYREAAFDEIELLRCASSATGKEKVLKEYGSPFDSGVVLLVDHFEHSGPHGRHVCMVFEMLGENLLKVIKNYDYRGISLPVVKNMARQICVGLDFLHRHCRIIHTDLKPENILVAVPPPPPSDLFIKSLIEQQASKPMGKKKGKGKGKTSGKKKTTTSDPSSKAEAKGAAGGGDTPLSLEQKKKIKRKMKKKRQRARKGEKGSGATGRRKQAGSGVSTQALSAIDEQREMELMEKASEPIGYNKIGGEVDLDALPTDDILSCDEGEGDDEDGGLDVTPASYRPSSLNSLSPPRHHSSVLLPMSSMPWMRESLLVAINFRSSLNVDLDESDVIGIGNIDTVVSTTPVGEMQTSPIHIPRAPRIGIDQRPESFEALDILPILEDAWVHPSSKLWSVIHMVGRERIIYFSNKFDSPDRFSLSPSLCLLLLFLPICSFCFILIRYSRHRWFGTLSLGTSRSIVAPPLTSRLLPIQSGTDNSTLILPIFSHYKPRSVS